MLNTMRSLALLDLNLRFRTPDRPLSELRKAHATELAPLLVEAADKIAKVYLLQAGPTDPNLVRMWGEDLTEDKAKLLPFNRPSGSQSAAIGPVFKRSWTPNKTPRYGPSYKILKTTDALSRAFRIAIPNGRTTSRRSGASCSHRPRSSSAIRCIPPERTANTPTPWPRPLP